MRKTTTNTAVRDEAVFADILHRVNLLPESRESRVEELKFLIEAGLYTVDPRRIAQRMLLER